MQEISRLLGDTVAATCERCLDPNLAFVDQSVRWPKSVTTCEVLETIFIPMLIFGDKYLPKNKDKRRKLNDVVFRSLDNLVRSAEESIKRGDPLFPGDPYFNDSGDRLKADSKGWPYTEANAFLISLILHFLSVGSHFGRVPDDLSRERLIGVAKVAIDQILGQFIDGQGWSHSTRDCERQIYFTWSIVETLAEVLEYAEKGEVALLEDDKLNTLRGELSQVLVTMEDYLFSAKEAIFSPEVAQGDTGIFYNNMQAFIILGILGTKRSNEMAQTLISLVANSHLFANQPQANYFMKHERFKLAKLEDRSILPLIVRAIATIYGEYANDDFHNITEKARLRNPWSYLVMSDRLKELKSKRTPDKLWGPEGSDYEIYYTERVVEALISCYYYVKRPNKSAHRLDLKFDPKRFDDFSKGLKNVGTQLTSKGSDDSAQRP